MTKIWVVSPTGFDEHDKEFRVNFSGLRGRGIWLKNNFGMWRHGRLAAWTCIRQICRSYVIQSSQQRPESQRSGSDMLLNPWHTRGLRLFRQVQPLGLLSDCIYILHLVVNPQTVTPNHGHGKCCMNQQCSDVSITQFREDNWKPTAIKKLANVHRQWFVVHV